MPVARPRDLTQETVFEAPREAGVEETRVGTTSRSGDAPAPQAPAGPALTATAGPLAGQVLPLEPGVTKIGKAPRAAGGLRILAVAGDRYMSKDHAILTLGSAALVLSDSGSTNGTFVNGARVTRTVLQDGDELRMGESTFRVRLPGA